MCGSGSRSGSTGIGQAAAGAGDDEPYPPYIPPPAVPYPSTIVIRNAWIVDGSEGANRYLGEVIVADGIISQVKKYSENVQNSDNTNNNETSVNHDESLVIDAERRLVLSPGFIDMHAHSDLHLLSHPSHVPKLTQGITTEVIGQDGIGYAPLINIGRLDQDEASREEERKRLEEQSDAALEYVRRQIAGWNGNPQSAPSHWGTKDEPQSQAQSPSEPRPFFTWRSVKSYLDLLDEHVPATNVAYLIPQGNLRLLCVGSNVNTSTNTEIEPATLGLGTAPVEATKQEVEAMQRLLRASLDEGAVGMSSGLTYVPGMYANTEELEALCQTLASSSSRHLRPSNPINSAGSHPDYSPYYCPHTRSYGLTVMEAYDEMLKITLKTGCALHLTHAILNFPPNKGRADDFLDLLRKYEERNVDISLDSYPYCPSSTSLSSVLPSWALAAGHSDVISRLNGTAKQQPVSSPDNGSGSAILGGLQLLQRIKDEVCVEGSDGYHGVPVDWNAVVIAGAGSEQGKNDQIIRSLVGKSISDATRVFSESPPAPLPPSSKHANLGALDIKDTLSLGDPWILFLYTLIIDDLGTTVVLHVGHEDNVRKIMKHPRHMMCTDGILAPKRPHPRVWASAGRYVGWYGRALFKNGDSSILGPDGSPERSISEDYPAPFREEGSLEDVIAHLTSRAAARLGLLFDPNTNSQSFPSSPRPRLPRGLIAPGYAADLVLFDPESIRDQATFANPNVPCSGVEWVIVNGKVAVDKGNVTGVRGGRTIRRDKDTGLVW